MFLLSEQVLFLGGHRAKFLHFEMLPSPLCLFPLIFKEVVCHLIYIIFIIFKVAHKCSKVASELVRDIFEFFDLFVFIILARNIDCKSILQETLK